MKQTGWSALDISMANHQISRDSQIEDRLPWWEETSLVIYSECSLRPSTPRYKSLAEDRHLAMLLSALCNTPQACFPRIGSLASSIPPLFVNPIPAREIGCHAGASGQHLAAAPTLLSLRNTVWPVQIYTPSLYLQSFGGYEDHNRRSKFPALR